MRHDLNGLSGVSRRAFLERAACAGALLMLPRAAAAADGMYVSLNGSLTRQMPWPDFARLAAKVGYGGVDVNLGQAKTEGVEATRALLKELNIKPGIANLPLQFATPDEQAFKTGLAQLPENAQFAAAIGLNRMMAVLSPASPVPKDERRTFIKDRVSAIAEVLQKSNIRLGLEFLGPDVFSFEREEPAHLHVHTARDRCAGRIVRPQHRRYARRLALASFRRHHC